MVKISAVSRGLVNFIDSEILPKMQGWQKWAFGTVAGVMAKKKRFAFKRFGKKSISQILGHN